MRAAVEVDVHGLGHVARAHAEEFGAHARGLEQEGVARREGEAHAVAAAEELDAHRVVEVAVGVEGEGGLQAALGDEVLKGAVLALARVAGVDDGGAERLVPNYVCILLKGVEYESCYVYHLSVMVMASADAGSNAQS